MKNTIQIFWIVALFCIGVGNFSFAKPHPLELELRGSQYPVIALNTDDVDSLTPILEMGKRFLDWVILINKSRPESEHLSLYTHETELAFPIESPRFSNPQIIDEIFTDLKTRLPLWVSSIVLKGEKPCETLSVTDEEFIRWGIEIDRLYQRAARWKLQEPDLMEYAKEKKSDIRGFYFLSREQNLKTNLENWTHLTETQKNQYRLWLEGLCYNTVAVEKTCTDKIKGLEKTPEKLYAFYQIYSVGTQKIWDSLFALGGKRTDVTWNSSNPNLMTVPFQAPSVLAVKDFLIKNIEDEWRWGKWQLQLEFSPTALSHIEFVPGSTPHVNDIAGNTITMDANAPLTEYDVQWTIRHEYGHVLGFVDCYVEFYDTDTKTMVSYQLDITNLMCSRKGKLKETHYLELKKNYLEKTKF